LQNNSGNNLTVSAGATSFAFTTAIVSGGTYNVTVLSQPSNPSQTCVVTNATGSVTTGNISSVQVACTTNSYTIGGTISGLTGTGLVLQNNGGNNLTVSAGATSFAFTTAIVSGGTYNATVFAQPSNPSQTCVLTNAAGPVTSGNISNIQVTCTSTFVYVTNERDDTIYAYSRAANGKLTVLPTSPFRTGSGPEGLAVDPSGRFLYVANVLASNVSGYSIAADGSLTQITGSPFPAASGAVSVTIDPTGQFLYVPSCGANCSGSGSGGIAAFTISPVDGTLTAVPGSPFTAGTFPYEMALYSPSGVSSGGPFAYVANGGSNNISAYLVQSTGALSAVSGSPFAANTSPLALSVDANPTFPRVFAVNTGSNNLSIFNIQNDGSLLTVSGSPIATGAFSDSVTADANQHLYVSGGSGVFGFTVNTALPVPIAGSPFAAGTGPSQLRIDPSGRFLYVVNAGSNNVSGYSVNPTDGSLTVLPGSPFATGSSPHYITFATR
jgi:6-phosphogluconolactonase (cycloisomerase 2 family)